MGEDEAEALAIGALSFIAGDDELMTRFVSLTGLDVSDLRKAASEPGFLVGVLDFLAGHDPDLIAFADAADVAPESIVKARHTLAKDHAGYE